MIETAPHISEMTPAQRLKARIAGVIGNVVEWYDFIRVGGDRVAALDERPKP